MGNYRGTTRCSNCYETGHNKAGCPQLKERIERLRAQNPDDWRVQQADAKAKKRNERATGKRVCAYCKCHREVMDSWDWNNLDEDDPRRTSMVEAQALDRWKDKVTTGVERDTLYGTGGERGVGHSVRACKYRKADVAARTAEIAALRGPHLERMIKIGFGPGASVVFSEDTNAANEHQTPGTFVIKDVTWQAIGLEKRECDLVSAEVATATHVAHLFNPRPGYGMTKRVTLPESAITVGEEDSPYRSRYTDRIAALHRPATEAKIRAAVPFGWIDAQDEPTQTHIMERLMSDVKTRAKK